MHSRRVRNQEGPDDHGPRHDCLSAHRGQGLEEEIQPRLKDDSHTVGMSVNQETYTADMQTASCASGATNGLAPTV